MGVTLDKKAIAEHTKNGGSEIIGLKGATFYDIAMAVSLPCRVGWEGIETCLRIPMNPEEQTAMNESVKLLKDFWAQVKEQ